MAIARRLDVCEHRKDVAQVITNRKVESFKLVAALLAAKEGLPRAQYIADREAASWQGRIGHDG
jgi:hypothetical protein